VPQISVPDPDWIQINRVSGYRTQKRKNKSEICRGVEDKYDDISTKSFSTVKMFKNFVITNLGLDPNPDSAK
jgi:hypothetical protein